MTDKEVLYIITIARCSSITKAAEQLFIAQPSLTQALHRIEEDYGAPFFYRVRGGLQLTEAGKTYLETATEIEQLYKNMRYALSDISGVQGGAIRLGITMFQGIVLLPELLTRFHTKYPRVEMSLLETSSAQLEELAANGKLDLIILHRPFRNYDLNFLSVLREEFLLATAPDDPDYNRLSSPEVPIPEITAEILQRKNLIMLTANQRIRQVADIICSTAGISPHATFSTASIETALALASKGMGAAFVPLSFSRFYNRYSPAYFRFPRNWNAGWELVVAYSKNAVLSRPCQELYKTLQECITSMPGVFL
ncbi:MAG: LysR family transcriptional regulator [Lawsonibacter sp.]|nr:LysR family transcriptional regulator [Lawsonibacter sp.]